MVILAPTADVPRLAVLKRGNIQMVFSPQCFVGEKGNRTKCFVFTINIRPVTYLQLAAER